MDIEQKYLETLDYLYGFVDYSLTHGSQLAAAHFDLQRMRDFMRLFDNPQDKVPIIHVAGTKGKGSVASFCASALQAQGYRVGLYTSPHLYDYAERIQVDGTPISHAELLDLVDEFRPHLDPGTELTTFEITTALAFLYFARREVSVVVLEVGLGGRLDATNIVKPLVSVITSISLDHTNILGTTLPAIAREKAGIIKPGVPVVISPQKRDVFEVIERFATENSSALVIVGEDYQYSLDSFSLDGQEMSVWSTRGEADLQDNFHNGIANAPIKLSIPLLGTHQVENAATAYATLQTVNQSGLKVSIEAIKQGFSIVRWPGRFEILRRNPPLVIDSAHNRDSARRLQRTLSEYFPDKDLLLVFGASEDKDIHGILAELLPNTRQVFLTRSFHPRAAAPEDLLKIAGDFQCPAVVEDSFTNAMECALLQADEDSVLLVTGSIFMAAEARHYWYNQNQNKENER